MEEAPSGMPSDTDIDTMLNALVNFFLFFSLFCLFCQFETLFSLFLSHFVISKKIGSALNDSSIKDKIVEMPRDTQNWQYLKTQNKNVSRTFFAFLFLQN